MKKQLVAFFMILLAAVFALELVFVPVDKVLASPPNVSLTTCAAVGKGSSAGPQCTLTAYYYLGAGSLTYCFLGEGALYMKGVYYPLTQPGASPAREIASPYCPAMHM